MKKFKLFKQILLTLFVFKILLTSSFSENETPTIVSNDLESESKLWETLDKSLKEKEQEEQKQKEKEKQRLKQAHEEQKQKEQEEQRQKEQEEQKLKQKQEEQRLKQAQEEQRQKERDKEKELFSKIFPENKLSIIAKIDNEIVTSHDLKVESQYLQALNPNLKNLPMVEITKIAKESIIREKIKTNEILKYYELGKDTTYLNKIIVNNYNKLGIKNDTEFKNYLSKYDLTIDDIKRKFEIETTWNILIYEKYKHQVEVDTKKIKKKLKEESKLNKQEIFLLSEIIFNAENKEKLDEKYKKILKSIEKIGFKNTANIYSISDTAKFGGSLGWIQRNQFSKLVIDELLKINVGEFTKPINIPGGVLIIKIDEKKVSELEIDFDSELKKMIQFEKEKQLKQLSSIHYKKIKNNIKINEN